jgi:hypothetical protein
MRFDRLGYYDMLWSSTLATCALLSSLCAQVVKVAPKKLTSKELEEKERAAQEELQRMDTDARLQVCCTGAFLFWIKLCKLQAQSYM